MQTYAIFRRKGWQDVTELEAAAKRSREMGDKRSDIRWIRSYVLQEEGRTFGTICIYQADDPAALQSHSDNADLPQDEVVAVVNTIVVREDPTS